MRFSLIILLAALVLTACGGMADMNMETAVPDSTTTQSSGMGMGMGNGMMARHHATIPEAYAGLTNPVAADEESLTRGADIYTTYCVVCHGEDGMGDGVGAANLDPAPAALAHTSRMLGDDYLYWRVSEGGAHDPFNSAMPAWESAFDETARWDVINYVRALSSGGMGQMDMGSGMGSGMNAGNMQEEDHTEMLATGVADGVITQAEAEMFETVHAFMDDLMAAGASASGSMGQNQEAMLSKLVEAGTITQEEMDAFTEVHDRLLEAGLMQ